MKHVFTSNVFLRQFDAVLIAISTFFLPGIFLYHLYLQNIAFHFITFHSTVIAALFFGFVSIALFTLFIFTSGSKEAGLIVIIMFWTLFWTFGQTYVVVNNFTIVTTTQFTIGLAILICLFLFFFRRYSFSFDKIRAVFRILPVIVVIFFFFNFIPSYNISRTNSTYSSNLFKTSFAVDDSLPTPDIYWILPDSMISTETLDRFFDEPLNEFRDALEQRGFQIYDDARLYTGITNFSISALFSPHFHDETWYEMYRELMHITGSEWWDVFSPMWVVFRDEFNANANHEILAALRQRGYEINYIAGETQAMLAAEPDRHFVLGAGRLMTRERVQNRFLALLAASDDFTLLLSMATPLVFLNDFVFEHLRSIEASYVPGLSEEVIENLNQDKWFNSSNEIEFITLLSATVDLPSPRFVFALSNMAHGHRWQGSNLDALPWDSSGTALDQIVPSHVHIGYLLINSVDLIIANNPDAVIVIQSDHGINNTTGGLRSWYYLLQYDFTDEEIFELRHSVFSAVRIPPAYGGLNAPIHPLNISRELVNRFVGQNYTLLP